MTESKNKRPIIVGVFILAGLLLLLSGVLLIGNMHETFTRKVKVISMFDDVSGLQAGNNVWFSGVKVGTVSKVDFYGGLVKVDIKIDEKALEYIRRDAKVKLSSDGLIGNRILVIYGGTASAPPIGEGDTLHVDKTLSTEEMMETLQENNINILAITKDFKTISAKLAAGEGSIGKLLNDQELYNSVNATIKTLEIASRDAQRITASLNDFTSKLDNKGTLANSLVSDTVVFASIQQTVLELQQIADTANQLIANLKEASSNPHTPVGVLLHDEQAGADLKEAIKNLESSSKKLDTNLEALQTNFLLRKYFKKKEKEEKKEEKQQEEQKPE